MNWFTILAMFAFGFSRK
ncbi:GlyGly-CTERM sorting domain-containing protein [Salmonella enterica subsp. enterica serovar Praha]|nr:GlyGly-CTERM sorting domain-containing protein [Salmonella enterica]EBQ6118144.1 GlyGly-CTERM sorting domain-containing protein [Salmonella enterica subsp. enterica serovar Praha]EAV4803776.1 GlyGly-CTERM sorting domain-containing protein [Salmonella enterica]EBJ6120838.1 GlyGly-CTERM sorting domain-containing protein [Salmonella enterica]EBO4025447.1 GlyGly-CTERM sorting domain-containing protein [Salmonella enterica]